MSQKTCVGCSHLESITDWGFTEHYCWKYLDDPLDDAPIVVNPHKPICIEVIK